MAATACNTRRQQAENPFFQVWETPYGVPPFDKILPEHYEPAFKYAMQEHLDEIGAIASSKDEPTFENTLGAYDRSGLMLERVGLVFEMLCSAEINDEMREIQEKITPKLSEHRDIPFYHSARIKSVFDRRAELNLDADQLRLTERIYNDFVRAGAQLDSKQKKRLRQINSELASMSVDFGNHTLAETNAFKMILEEPQTAGLPEDVKASARQRAIDEGLGEGKYLMTLDTPSRLAVLTYSILRELREQMYKAYVERGNHGDANDNKELVQQFARLRNEKAKLLGYSDFSTYVISDQMAGTPAAVYKLLDEIWTPALDKAKAPPICENNKGFLAGFVQ